MKKLFFIMVVIAMAYPFSAQNISTKQVKEDLTEFSHLIKTQSSYYQIANINLEKVLKNGLDFEGKDSIPIIEITYFIQSVMAQINDSHASVSFKEYDDEGVVQNNMRFPFTTAPFKNDVLALSKTEKRGVFKYYHEFYPYLKEVDGKSIHSFLDYYSFDSKRYPHNAHMKRGLNALRKIGEMYTRMEETLPNPFPVVLTNGSADTTLMVNTHNKNSTWRYLGNLRELPVRRLMKDRDPFEYESLIVPVDESVAYMMIPKMIGYGAYPDFEAFFEDYLESLRIKKPKAIIFDIRGNSGGSRDLIQTLSKYITNEKQSPWVANMALVRTDQYLNEDISSMDSKYLHIRESVHFEEAHRKAIDKFKETIDLKFEFAEDKFSAPYFMVMDHHSDLYLDIPIYILCDEGSFSASSVMASVFKGLDNVKICGTTTNGSSGRSRDFFLSNSNIKVKLSTMLSFQRNGKPLDGHGTEPDILIERDLDHVLGLQDSQLKKLIEIAKE